MFKILSKHNRGKDTKRKGFSLVELLVTLLIMSVIAGIATPIYLNQKSRAQRSVAETAGKAMLSNFTSQLLNYTSFGTTNGTIVVNTTVSPAQVTITLGTGATSPAVFTELLTAGVTASGVTYANTIQWCLAVVKEGQTVIFTDAGFTNTQTSCGTTPGTNAAAAVLVDYLVVAGGGGGGRWWGGGGGAGGYVTGTGYSASGTITVTVGAGGAAGPSDGVVATSGGNSVFGTITAIGGGYGSGGSGGGGGNGATGGSGGGGGGAGSHSGGTGTVSQGNTGGSSANNGGAGGGGAGGAGGVADSPSGTSGYGGPGSNANATWATDTSSGVSGYFAGGGGGSYNARPAAASGGGGLGATDGTGSTAGTANTGSGGGGGSGGFAASAGGSGIVIVRISGSYTAVSTTGSPTRYEASGYTYYKFTSSGSITF